MGMFWGKIADESKVSVRDEAKNLDVFSRNSRITEILELVFNQPMTKSEMESILVNFWDKYDNFSQKYNEKEKFCEFDILSIYMVDYIFNRDDPNLIAVSRSLYCYIKCLNIPVANRIDIINGTENDFINGLREFTNFSSAEGEDILADAFMKSLFVGNLGLTLFLLRFGLVDIPQEVQGKTRKILKKLVERFNDILRYHIENGQAEDMQPYIKLGDLLSLMKESGVNLKRSLMTFLLIVIVSEYRLNEKIDNDNIKRWMEGVFFTKLVCLYEALDATSEARLKFQDFEIFIEKFLNPLINADFGKSLADFTRNTHFQNENFDIFNPRSLKDLTRSTIRDNLQTSLTFPEQVNQFDLPDVLKEFLLYHDSDIFGHLKASRNAIYYEEALQYLLDGI